jgi:hypothetical protein
LLLGESFWRQSFFAGYVVWYEVSDRFKWDLSQSITSRRREFDMSFEKLEAWSIAFADAVWGLPMVALLLGGGTFFLIISRALPYRYLGHAFAGHGGSLRYAR